MKISPVRAAQTPGMAGFCATLSGLSPAGVPTRGRREARQPLAVFRSPCRAFPNGNPQVWDFLPGYQKRWNRNKSHILITGKSQGPSARLAIQSVINDCVQEKNTKAKAVFVPRYDRSLPRNWFRKSGGVSRLEYLSRTNLPSVGACGARPYEKARYPILPRKEETVRRAVISQNGSGQENP